ncbi:MAG: hypothetical protein KBS85_02670 [Lachnospiraceae bacterium]|nr:hypothetical protein [Candidatus Merdinaster equi]
MNWEKEMELQRKIRTSREKILKYGTYTMETKESMKAKEDAEKEEYGESYSDAASDTFYECGLPDNMPARTEDFIQNNIDSLMKTYGSRAAEESDEEVVPQLSAEEDAKVAEILAKFEHNIQNNVNSLFDN